MWPLPDDPLSYCLESVQTDHFVAPADAEALRSPGMGFSAF